MKLKDLTFVLIISLSLVYKYLVKSESEDCFRAAVYQHLPLGNYTTENPSTIANRNLDVFEEIASKASEEDVNILVFPEDGIINTGYSRTVIAEELAEQIPDPLTGDYNPCENPDKYKSLVKTYRLSCLAKNNGLYIVADYGDRVNCDASIDPNCPKDGYYLFNTAVAFASDGSIAAKYHKMQLFHETHYDVPLKPDFIYFDTPFGRMGLFICFDIIFQNPGIELINKYGVQTMIFPTWWFDEVPFRTSLQTQESWAVTNRVNLLASNIHVHEYGSVGGGIYSGKNGQMITSDISEKSPHLLIADIPIDSRNTGAKCLTNRFNKTILNTKFSDDSKYKPMAEMDLNNSALFKLNNNEDSVQLCHNNLCCQLDYNLGSENFFKEEPYWFFVANRTGYGLSQKRYPTWDEICGLFLCDDNKCQTFSTQTKQTIFKNLEIKGEMSTNYTYPSATTNHLKLISSSHWSYENNGKINSEVKLSLQNFPEPLISIGLYGRSYDRDPPYKH